MNIEDLRTDLVDVFQRLKEKRISAKDAKELVNCSGKIILSARVELDYHKFLGDKNKIDFLETNPTSDVVIEVPKTPENRGRKKKL